MDPNKAWENLSKATAQECWNEAAEIAEGLVEWLAKGGFPPHITGLRRFDRIVAQATCEAIACWEVV